MEYDLLLDEAYKKIKPVGAAKEGFSCGRFDILKVTGHHEGSRTVIKNFVQVADCIRRDPEHLMKFLSRELASSCEIDGDRLILSRRVSSIDVNDKVCKYVGRYVLCSKCNKPDTELDNENNRLFLRCLACGNKGEVSKI